MICWLFPMSLSNGVLVLVLPAVGVLGAVLGAGRVLVPMAGVAVAYYFATLVLITAGYHRHHAHRLWRPHRAVAITMAALGALAGVGPIRRWCTYHLAHHKHAGHPQRDPCCVSHGLGWAYIGWVVAAPPPSDPADTELESDPVVAWQEQHYWQLFLAGTVVFPLAVGVVVGAPLLSLCVVGFLRMALVQQSVFYPPLVGHMVGSRVYDFKYAACDLALANLITGGEGRANFHHAFPRDYRGGNIAWYDVDPTKWCIEALALVGLAHGLQKMPLAVVEQLRVQELQRQLDAERARLNWGIDVDRLPRLTPGAFRRAAAATPSRALVVVDSIIHDVLPFIADHPGGEALVRASVGKDATLAFNGAVYAHLTAARNLLATMRVAVLTSYEGIEGILRTPAAAGLLQGTAEAA